MLGIQWNTKPGKVPAFTELRNIKQGMAHVVRCDGERGVGGLLLTCVCFRKRDPLVRGRPAIPLGDMPRHSASCEDASWRR